MGFNLFHILGDMSHTSSKLILIWAMHSNSSSEGECGLPCADCATAPAS